MTPGELAWTPRAVAVVEERRIAAGVGDIADEAEPCMGGVMACSGPDYWTNAAWGVALDAEPTAGEVADVVTFFEEHGATPRVEVSTLANAALWPLLAEAGFRLIEIEHVFSRQLPGEAAWPAGHAVAVQPTGDDEAADVQTRLMERAVHGGEASAVALRVGRRLRQHPRIQSFVATVGGEPAGIAGLETHGEIAALFAGAVLPAFRRRGVQTALIRARLEAAQALGVRLITAGGQPGSTSERNFLRHGFTLSYARLAFERLATT